MAKKRSHKRQKHSTDDGDLTQSNGHKDEGVEEPDQDEEVKIDMKDPVVEQQGGDVNFGTEPDAPVLVSDGRYRNKQRCLVLCSRGVTARYRHLLEDLRTLMPHHKKESKLDPGSDGVGRAVNDICEMRSCNTVLFLECRKRQDAYLWLGKAGGQSVGPSARFHLTNLHTMDELRLTGNCMKGSRPVLTFDDSFTHLGHLKLLKELFVDVFGTPRGHPKSKPFVDRVMGFYYADKKVRHCRLVILCGVVSDFKMKDERISDRQWDENTTSYDYDGMRRTQCVSKFAVFPSFCRLLLTVVFIGCFSIAFPTRFG